jgi:hypothetical protein
MVSTSLLYYSIIEGNYRGSLMDILSNGKKRFRDLYSLALKFLVA